MAEPMTDSNTLARSTPRAEPREHILRAALELVAEVGYDRFSMDALAERAHASKATIYRHWSGKAEVVVEAVRCRASSTPYDLPDTGSLRNDLVAFLSTMCDAVTSEDGAFIAGVLRAMQSDPVLAEQMRNQMVDAKSEVTRELVARAVGRGEVPADADAGTLTEVMTAMLLTRNLVLGAPLDDAFVTHLVDEILLPMLAH